MVVRRELLITVALVLSACAASAGAPAATQSGIGGVGVLPDPMGTGVAVDRTTTTSTIPVTLPLNSDTVGEHAGGNRVLVIGDSILASTSKRYTNDLCKILVPNGWQVELEAETGRFVEFGKKVLDSRLGAGWDAAVIGLGSNFNGDLDDYRERMSALVERLAPRPVILITVTEFLPNRAKVNEIIHEMAEQYDNVVVVDWAATTADDPHLLGGDNLHLTNEGRAALAFNIGLAMGVAPETPGKCFDAVYTDDSALSVDGSTTTSTTIKKTGGGTKSTTTTTIKPRTGTTTTAPKPTTTTSPPDITLPPLPTGT